MWGLVIDDQRRTNEHAIWWTNRDLGQSQLDLFNAGVESMGRTAVDNQTVRTVFIIRPDKRVGLF